MEPLAAVAARLHTLRDLVRFGASAFNEAGLHFGHGTDNALDEALALALHALRLDHTLAPAYLDSRLTEAEIGRIHALYARRITERLPVPYLTQEAWFAGLPFYVDERVVIPRSPIAELLERRVEPWIDPERARRVLDLCCGSGCIGIAAAYVFPDAEVDLVDCDPGALEVAAQNVREHGVADRVRTVESDLFAGLAGRRYDLILSNPPYVAAASYATLPPEYRHEPETGLESGPEGLDHPLAILAGAAEHLNPGGVLALEVGESRNALEQTLPGLNLVWVELERGGEGLAVVTREALAAPGALEHAA